MIFLSFLPCYTCKDIIRCSKPYIFLPKKKMEKNSTKIRMLLKAALLGLSVSLAAVQSLMEKVRTVMILLMEVGGVVLAAKSVRFPPLNTTLLQATWPLQSNLFVYGHVKRIQKASWKGAAANCVYFHHLTQALSYSRSC